MNEIGNQTHSFDKKYYVHVTIPPIPKPLVMEVLGREEQVVGPASFLELQEDYLFWGHSLLRYFPRIERWASAEARQFEKSMIYRLRYLAHFVYGVSSGQTPLQQLEMEWTWEEIVRRGLQAEALRVIDQVGVERTQFLRDRETFKPGPVSMWGPLKRMARIGLILLAMGWGISVTYWLIRLDLVTELWTRLLSFIK